jgi:CRISPR system Cascade subunit CasE
VSTERPNLDALADETGRSVEGTVYQSRDYSPLLDRLEEGQVYAFRLAGNAARSGRRSQEAKRTQRFGHVTPAQQIEWLMQKAEMYGFHVRPSMTGEADVAVVGRRRTVFSRDGQRVVIAVAEFIGHLQVIDPNAMHKALTAGIGHARAYGCGLLTLAAPR